MVLGVSSRVSLCLLEMYLFLYFFFLVQVGGYFAAYVSSHVMVLDFIFIFFPFFLSF